MTVNNIIMYKINHSTMIRKLYPQAGPVEPLWWSRRTQLMQCTRYNSSTWCSDNPYTDDRANCPQMMTPSWLMEEQCCWRQCCWWWSKQHHSALACLGLKVRMMKNASSYAHRFSKILFAFSRLLVQDHKNERFYGLLSQLPVHTCYGDGIDD